MVFFNKDLCEKFSKDIWLWIRRAALRFQTRVARWFVYKSKIQIWVNFGGSCNGR
jgi:hypothetical protein